MTFKFNKDKTWEFKNQSFSEITGASGITLLNTPRRRIVDSLSYFLETFQGRLNNIMLRIGL